MSSLEQRGSMDREIARDLWQSNHLLFCRTDSGGKLAHSSPGFSRIFSDDGDGLLTRPLSTLIHPEDRTDFSKNLEEVCQRGAIIDRFPIRLLAPEGRVVAMDVVGEPWRENGSILGATLVWVERSESRIGTSASALADLDQFQDVARVFMANLFDPMVLLNMEGRIVQVNPPMLDMLGYRRLDLIGRPVAILFERKPENLAKAMIRFAKGMRTGQMQDAAATWLDAHGHEVAVTTSGSTIRSDAGALVGMVVTARDERKNALMTALEKKNRELEAAYDGLKRLDQMKDDILSLVGHELRAPLANILGYAEFIFEWDMAEAEKKKFARIIYQESHRLSRLVNDILDLSRLEAGRMPFIYTTDRINRVIEAARDSLSGEAEKKKIKLVLDLDDSLDPLEFDPDRIQQVVTNIVHNAIKFTDEGKTITVTSSPTENGVMVAISDEGPGIPKERASRVFNKFEQVDDVKHHSMGAGLGMPIAKQIIEEGHGGRIWFENLDPGPGAVFKFTLPERRPAP